MAFTESEEIRIEALEEAVNDVQTSLNNCPTTRQMKQLLTIRQNEIEDLKTRVAALESAIQVLQGG